MLNRLILLFSLSALVAVGFGVQPPRFHYQARLVDGSGQSLTGLHTAYFSLYDGGDENTSSGVLLYSESANVAIDGGVLNHSVGSGVALFGKLQQNSFSSNNDMFLQIGVDTPENIILPRSQIEPVPIAIAKQPTSLFGQFGGSGADGDHVVAGTEQMTKRRVEYRNLTVPGGTELQTNFPNVWIAVQDTCTINGSISADRQSIAGSSANAEGQPAGTTYVHAHFAIPRCVSGAGGHGGDSVGNYDSSASYGGGAQTAGGRDTAHPLVNKTSDSALIVSAGAYPGSGQTTLDNFAPLLDYGGAGGGAGTDSASGFNALGGRGGGCIYIECNNLILTGSVHANADDGVDNNGPVQNGGSGGGGGGGGGGVVLIRARRIITKTGGVAANGGLGGHGFNGGSSGEGGGFGYWDVVEVH